MQGTTYELEDLLEFVSQESTESLHRHSKKTADKNKTEKQAEELAEEQAEKQAEEPAEKQGEKRAEEPAEKQAEKQAGKQAEKQSATVKTEL